MKSFSLKIVIVVIFLLGLMAVFGSTPALADHCFEAVDSSLCDFACGFGESCRRCESVCANGISYMCEGNAHASASCAGGSAVNVSWTRPPQAMGGSFIFSNRYTMSGSTVVKVDNIGFRIPCCSYTDTTAVAGQEYIYAVVYESCPTSVCTLWSNRVSCGTPLTPTPTPTPTPIPSWFQTIDGDVHARGGISAAITPPAGQFNARTSKTVVVSHGGSVDADFRVESNWRIPAYPGSTTPYDYTYFFGRLGGGASTAPAIVDGLADGSSGIYQVGVPGNYVIATSGGGLDNVRAVIFVPGDLIITGNFTPPPTTSIAFIVRGTIAFSPSVTQFNGILVSGNAGPPATGGIGTGIGPGQLTLNGMMISYGGFTLGRWNATPSLPSELVQYNPRYIIELGNLLGTSSFVWEEVAP